MSKPSKIKKWVPPVDKDNKPMWVPVVVKDRDYLLGQIDAFKLMSLNYDIDIDNMYANLASDRLNDVMTNNKRLRWMTSSERKNCVKDLLIRPDREDHPENDDCIHIENYFGVSCNNCGMYYGFEDKEDVPAEDFDCMCCGSPLMIYTYEDDEFILYDGDQNLIEQAVEDIQEEIIKNNNLEDDEED